MPRKVFTAGEVLAASDVNEFLVDQTVMVFAGSAARGSAIPSPTEGMYAHLSDTDELTYYDGSAWANRVPSVASGKILQIVSTIKTDTFSLATSGMTDITGLSASITPSSTSSKVLVFLNLGTVDCSTASNLFGDVTRAGTPIGVGDVAGSRVQAGWFIATKAADEGQSCSWSFLDSPATTSATVYQARLQRTGTTAFINRGNTDSNTGNVARSVSTITLLEVGI